MTPEMYVFNPATSTWSRTGDLNSMNSYISDAVVLDPAAGPCGNNCGKVYISGQLSRAVHTLSA